MSAIWYIISKQIWYIIFVRYRPIISSPITTMSVLRILFSPSSPWRHRLMAAGNVIASSYFFLMVFCNSYLSLYLILPQVYSNNPGTILFHRRIIYFFAVNVVGNYFLGYRTDSSIKMLKVPYSQRSAKNGFSWTCKKCEVKVPNRCHHCPLCSTCILKRDHHCFFMCTCIGYYNQKYFIMYCFYQFISGLYAAVLILIYMKFLYNVQFTGMTSFITLLPMTFYDWWFEQTVESFHMVLMAIFYGSLVAGFAAGGFFYWQIALIIFGQTTHESKHGIEDYSTSVWEHFKDVFGRWWFVSLFLPLPLPPSGNGVYVKQKKGKLRWLFKSICLDLFALLLRYFVTLSKTNIYGILTKFKLEEYQTSANMFTKDITFFWIKYV